MTRFSLRSWLKRSVAVSLTFVLFGAEAWLFAQQPPAPAQAPAGAAQTLSPDQLDDLVAPIALYPDPLLSQLLVACTYPLEVVEAQQWLQQNNSLSGSALMDAAKQQNWDPSVTALVAFPDVLNRLTSDVRWTTDLGNAFLSQQADVMAAVQRMRQRAQANGKLQSTPQQTVTTETQGDQSAIQIMPANPDVIYVPYYDPQYVWGPPAWGYYPYLAYPAWGWGFWPGIDIGFCFGGWGGWGFGGWGWGWGPNWFGGGIFVNHGFFGRYGFRGGWGRGYGGFGGRGFGGTSVWAHDPGHRLGVPYNSRGLTSRYGAASVASRANMARNFNGGSFARNGFGQRGGAGQSYGRNSFGQSYGANRGGQSYGANRGAVGQSARSYGQYGASGRSGVQGGQSYRGGAYGQGAARSYQGSQGAARSYGGFNSSRSYSAPSRSYGGGSFGSRSYASPSYSAPRSSGGFSGSRSYSAPSRSFGGGGFGGSRSFGGGSRSFGGGGGFGGSRSFGGGGGHSFGGGGGHFGGGGHGGGGRR